MANQCGAGADHDVFYVFFGFDSPIDQNRGGIGTETTGLIEAQSMHALWSFHEHGKNPRTAEKLTKSTNPAQNQYAAGNCHEISQTKPKPKLLENIMHPNDSKLNQLSKIQANT
jgi:hypothetical protein